MGGRRLGQNFLLDPSILGRIVDAGAPAPEDLVVEIGPGLGAMTELIADRAGRVIAIELDGELFDHLTERFRDRGNVEIVRMDCLKYDFSGLPPFSVIANIPYYITTPILFRLLENSRALRTMILTVQKEVAERMVARPGTKDYGVLTVMLAVRSEVRLLFGVPRGAFRPPPKVDSSVVRIEPLQEPRIPADEMGEFRNLVRAAFGQRRKTVRNALRTLAPRDVLEASLHAVGIPPGARPDALSVEDYIHLSRVLRQVGPSEIS